jgi:hypothetical protein
LALSLRKHLQSCRYGNAGSQEEADPMTYLMAVTVAAGVALAVALLDYLIRATGVWRYFSGERVVTCPEGGCPAAVHINLPLAALTEVGNDRAIIRLAACSRWPVRRRCGQGCLAEARDPSSAVSAIVSHWCAGKSCMYCGAPLRDDPSEGRRAAFRAPDGVTCQWTDVPAEQLPNALRTGRPVCWKCHLRRAAPRHPFPSTSGRA